MTLPDTGSIVLTTGLGELSDDDAAGAGVAGAGAEVGETGAGGGAEADGTSEAGGAAGGAGPF